MPVYRGSTQLLIYTAALRPVTATRLISNAEHANIPRLYEEGDDVNRATNTTATAAR